MWVTSSVVKQRENGYDRIFSFFFFFLLFLFLMILFADVAHDGWQALQLILPLQPPEAKRQ